MKYLLRICCFFLAGVTLIVAKPAVSISASAVTPRMHMWSEEDQLHWLTLVNYNQNLGKKLQVRSSFEVGSEHEYLENPFRIYLLDARLNLKSHTLGIGRQTYWSGLTQLRFDGIKLDFQSKKIGSITMATGYDAVIDFSDTTWLDYPVTLLTWGKTMGTKKLGTVYWQEYFDQDVHTFTGFQFSERMDHLGILGQFAYDLTEDRVHTYKIDISHRNGSTVMRAGIRQKRFMVKQVYHWAADPVSLPATFYTTYQTLLSNDKIFWNQLAYRMGTSGTLYMQSTVMMKKIGVTGLLGSRNENLLIGGQLRYTSSLSSSIKWGSQLELNAITMGDDIVEPIQSTGFYSWIGWSPSNTISCRLFYRFISNPYYSVDGRGGVTVYVAL